VNEHTFPNQEWDLRDKASGGINWDKVHLALLMDIRRELRKLNNVLHCQNFLTIPYKLDAIRRNTQKPKRKKGTK